MNIRMSPPDQLRHAASLLDQAKASQSRDDVMRMLGEARDITARATSEIDRMLSPDIEDIGASFRHIG